MMPLYDAFEGSNFLGRDIRLYSFQRGDAVWLYAAADRDYVYSGQNYTAMSITDDGMKQKSEIITDDFTVTVPNAHPVALMFRGTPPSELVKVMVRQVQYGDTEAPLMWTGYVSSVKFKDSVSTDLVCNTQVAYLNRRGLRLTYQRQCPHALYDKQCRVDKDSVGEAAKVRSHDGISVWFDLVNPPAATPLGQYAGRFTAGFLEFAPVGSQGDYIERRPIQFHNNDVAQLLSNTDGIVDGMLIALYPGCAHVPSACHLFNNIANYGGFPMMPGKSPFDGDPVF